MSRKQELYDEMKYLNSKIRNLRKYKKSLDKKKSNVETYSKTLEEVDYASTMVGTRITALKERCLSYEQAKSELISCLNINIANIECEIGMLISKLSIVSAEYNSDSNSLSESEMV